MCTMIAEKITIDGAGKQAGEWFTLHQANISYDHPFHAPHEHTLNLDFVDAAQGLGARVAVELSLESARALVATIQAVLAEAEAGGHLEA